jgi:hypothetical protein
MIDIYDERDCLQREVDILWRLLEAKWTVFDAGDLSTGPTTDELVTIAYYGAKESFLAWIDASGQWWDHDPPNWITGKVGNPPDVWMPLPTPPRGAER